MNYAQPKPPVRRIGGIAFVVGLHAVIVYALLTGLATKVVDVIRQPIETRIIEEIKPPPPKHVAPPPPFVPPPEVRVAAPPSPNAIAAQSTTPAPSAPVAPPAPPAAAAPVSTSVGVVCPNSTQVRAAIRYPREALKDNLTGDVVVTFVVGTDGNVKDLSVTQSAAPVLDRAAENAVRQFHCVAQGEEVRVQVPFSFKLD
ncbi:energy transducer TonB [Burkholderia contaminans]|uniref:energy transducer TonB n=1 Tax=Burkholderia contaminans TaxID=488447 RepID=UPI000CFFDB4A|nr:energy transducer TonB [Burkholderia contaminans]PRD86633.1 energy transducer TonB [Burkholderia contaminans]